MSPLACSGHSQRTPDLASMTMTSAGATELGHCKPAQPAPLPSPLPPPVPMTRAFCAVLELASSPSPANNAIMLAVVSEQMEQMTNVNFVPSTNWRPLQGGKGSCRLRGRGGRGCGRKTPEPQGGGQRARLSTEPTTGRGALGEGPGTAARPPDLPRPACPLHWQMKRDYAGPFTSIILNVKFYVTAATGLRKQ